MALYSELEIDKSDLSLCNQALQNSVINILPRVGPLTVNKLQIREKILNLEVRELGPKAEILETLLNKKSYI